MRKYLFGTGIIGAVTGGLTLLRGMREGERFTWRTGLAWLSWGITLVLAIGAIVDTRRASTGHLAPADSPVFGKETKLLKRRLHD
ncbi:MAG TPA: hypothetical protein VFN24_04520 [Microbacterium sp.]|nr:hypothetical protein [Microbacterium sp.]